MERQRGQRAGRELVAPQPGSWLACPVAHGRNIPCRIEMASGQKIPKRGMQGAPQPHLATSETDGADGADGAGGTGETKQAAGVLWQDGLIDTYDDSRLPHDTRPRGALLAVASWSSEKCPKSALPRDKRGLSRPGPSRLGTAGGSNCTTPAHVATKARQGRTEAPSSSHGAGLLSV